MKRVYDRYKAGHVEIIRSKLNKREEKIVEKFLTYCGGTAGARKLMNIERILLQIRDVMQVPYDKITLDDLRKFLAVLNKSDRLTETQNDIKKLLKRFLKEQYPDWNTKFNGLKDIKTKDGMNHKKLNAKTILTSKDIEKLVRGAESLRYKALIMLMFESAGRPEEILKLRWNDLDLEKSEVKLHSSKTGRVRVNPLKESIIHLKRYKQEYPYPDIMAEDFIFPHSKDRKEHQTVGAVDMYFRVLGEKTITKRLFPYIIRHTRLTGLQKELPPKIYEKFADHSIEMAKRYSHLTSDDVREVMMERIYHIEEVTEQDKEELGKLKKKVENIEVGFNKLIKLWEKGDALDFSQVKKTLNLSN